MFKPNNQPPLFGFENELNEAQKKQLDNSREKWFYNLVFRNINEDNFKPLFSDKGSRPNAPVNVLVAALILKESKGISYNELINSVMFDLRFKAALGLSAIDEAPFTRATLFNFQNRVMEYESQTGVNLIEKLFEDLSAKNIEQLELKTEIQRTDSTMIASNIKKYSRIKLLTEVIIRLYKTLNQKDQKYFAKHLSPYLKEGADKYIYSLESKDLPCELNKLGKMYYRIHARIQNNKSYCGSKEYVNFMRVFQEHFVVVKKQAKPKPTKELHSGMLQSPDDMTATYRKKKDQENRGYSLNATETASPNNSVQIVTDITVTPNNKDDSKILHERLDKIKQKYPYLNELHTDGGYGSAEVDNKLSEHDINQITTAVRGRKKQVDITIEQVDKSPKKYYVKCPVQKTESKPTKKRHKAVFHLSICEKCSLSTHCQVYKSKGKIYFDHQYYLANRRSQNIYSIPEERRKIRPNVEALMREFKVPTNAGKLKVRGLFKASVFAFSMGIAINFGRVFRYLLRNNITGPFTDGYAIFVAKKCAQIALKGLIFIIQWLKSIFQLNNPGKNLTARFIVNFYLAF